MTMPAMRSNSPSTQSTGAARLWSGGIATAVVAGLVALLGVLAFRWLFHVPILAPASAGAYGDANTTVMVFASAGMALIATATLHLLLLTTPRPLTFFGWIIGLATLVAVVFPFSTTAPLSQKFATATVNLFIGIAIGSLLTAVGSRFIRSG